MLCDLHNHTWYSYDGRSSVDELCASAVQKGVGVLTITEHCEFDSPGCDVCRSERMYYLERQPQRLREMADARVRWAPQLELLCGIELGQPHVAPEEARAVLESADFDLVIGSMHDVRGGRSLYRGFDYSTLAGCDEAFELMFREAVELVTTVHVDTFGHYDYPLRKMQGVTPPTMLRWRPLMQPLFRALVETNTALELNTVGYRFWMHQPAGEDWVLQDYRAAGGRMITVGSDAHEPQDLASGTEIVYDSLRRNGFDSVTVFEKRIARQVAI